ncbi:MAG: hypothetical protein AB7V13_13485 [Pseudorhodoplanes sp.]|uniref:hypothetical protein n=1 Tax=Pseudorhodoplanes sp. TaxID=1934341 RepID=UPI003D0FBBE3
MINVIEIQPGSKVSLVGGAVGEVIENMADGMWLMVRYLKIPGGEAGLEELCHAQDVIDVLPNDAAI